MDAAGWDARYAKGQVWSSEPNRFFAEIVEELAGPPGRAVDLACGEGRNAVWLAEQGWDVTAVDFSATGIERGRAGAAARGADVRWVVADLEAYELGVGAWDLVAHVYLHWPTAVREPFLRRCAAAVAPGGVLVVVGHDRDNIEHGVGGPQDPDVLSTPEEQAARFVEEGLEIVRAERVRRTVTVEPGHGAVDGDHVRDAIDHVVVARRPTAG
jgi:SAM-dependent methyltransferase